ncbi:MAG: hypothetical protein ACYS47_04265, partial [Planctomycetota bacterium]
MKTAICTTLFLLLISTALAQSPVPPPPGYIWLSDWIHVPGISSTGSSTVQWGPAGGANAYDLEEDVSASFPAPTLVYQGPGRSVTLTGRGDGNYYYRVRGRSTVYNTTGGWIVSDLHVVDSTVGTVPSIPLAPASVTVPASSGSGIVPVSWTPVSGIQTFDLQYSSRLGGSAPPISPNWWSTFVNVATGLTQTHYDHTP